MRDIELLKEMEQMLREGASYLDMAKRFDKTKCAIAGLVYRYFRDFDSKKINPHITEEKRKTKKESKRTEKAPRLSLNPELLKNALEYEHCAKHPDPRFLSDGYCRAILGQPKDMTCCGHKTQPGKVYCDRHWKLHHHAEPPRRISFTGVFK